MSDTVTHRERCPTEGCDTKGDNLARYEDGHAHCFACGYHESASGEARSQLQPVAEGTAVAPLEAAVVGGAAAAQPRDLGNRRLERKTLEKYGYLVGEDERGTYHLAPYTDGAGKVLAYKRRRQDKKFDWVGSPKGTGLFGQNLAREGGRRIVITEGEIDAMSVAQAMGLRWAAVSVRNGAAGARKDVAEQLVWLSTYETVVVLFDNDEPGQRAAAQVAELFEPGKCAIAALPLKDANEMLVAGRAQELVNACWEAKAYRPDGVVEMVDLIDEILKRPEEGLAYPWQCANEKTHGQRKGEIVTWTAGSGIGKSQILREIAFDLHRRHGKKVGYIALEESKQHTTLAQVSLALNLPLHIPAVRALVSDDAIRAEAANTLTGMYAYDHFGSTELERIEPIIRYFAKACGVEWIILDHLSIMISGNADQGDERKRIDSIMTSLATLVRELNIGLHLISHLRKSDGTPFEEGGRISLADLRGSGSIGQLSNLVLGLERDQQAEGDEANVTRIRVIKNRFTGETGPGGWLRYHVDTGRISECAEPKSDSTPTGRPVTGEF
jgi:twinkle protein